VTEQALLDMINKGVNDTLIVEDAVKDKPRSPVPVYQGMTAEKGNLERDSVGKPVSGAIKTTQTAGGNEAPVGDELPPQCTTCGRFKVPVGYPEPEQFCGPTSCPGYAEAPAPETEWPLERQASAKDTQARREHAVLVEQRQAIRNAIILEDDRTMAEHWGDGRDAWQREDLEALDRYETLSSLAPAATVRPATRAARPWSSCSPARTKCCCATPPTKSRPRCCSMT
jgi:hypothetical protein